MLKSGRAPDYRDRDYAIKRRPEPTRYQLLKGVVTRFFDQWAIAAAALKEIHDSKLYKEQYPTFDEFCAREYGIKRAHAYRLLEAVDVRESVKMSHMGDKINLRQAVALAPVASEERVEVLESVARTGPVTAKRIAQAVAARKPPPKVIDAEIARREPLIDGRPMQVNTQGAKIEIAVTPAAKPEPEPPPIARHDCPWCRCAAKTE